jgi:hypothetical protein
LVRLVLLVPQARTESTERLDLRVQRDRLVQLAPRALKVRSAHRV